MRTRVSGSQATIADRRADHYGAASDIQPVSIRSPIRALYRRADHYGAASDIQPVSIRSPIRAAPVAALPACEPDALMLVTFAVLA